MSAVELDIMLGAQILNLRFAIAYYDIDNKERKEGDENVLQQKKISQNRLV